MVSAAIKIVFFLALAGLLCSQENIKAVQGNGAGITKNNNSVLRGTFGQNITGRKHLPALENNVGFWYSASQIMKNVDAGSIVTLPYMEAETGDTVEIPLLLINSKNLLRHLPLKFEAVIRFNSTILFPLDSGINCGESEICQIRINGVATDTTGILAVMKFEAKLGAVTATDLEITDFKWKDINAQTIRKNGFFQLNGVCIVDGVARLIKRSHQAGIFNIYPNPAAGMVRLDIGCREKGIHTFAIINQNGNTVKEFIKNISSAGEFQEELFLEDIPSGSYHLLMMTPNELFLNKLQVIR